MMGDSELVPVPTPDQPELPTPQDFGPPENANAIQFDCWRRQELFIAAYQQHGILALACKETGIPLHTVEHWSTNETQGFKKRRALADRSALGVVEAEIHRRGIEGIDHPVIHQGKITDTYKQYSDNLLMFRAKRLDPEYKDNPPPVADDSARQALEAMTRAVVQFNADSIQININQGESGSEEKPDSGLPEALEPGP